MEFEWNSMVEFGFIRKGTTSIRVRLNEALLSGAPQGRKVSLTGWDIQCDLCSFSLECMLDSKLV